MTKLFASLALGAGMALVWSGPAAASEPGVDGSKILFGQSAAFDGPASALGAGMRQGIDAAFAEANAAGGVDGRMLELVGYDDGYEPERAIENVRRLIDDDGVFALIGAVGTPTSKAATPIALENDVPFIGPFTGAEFLRAPFEPQIVNVRASYFQETEELVERLTADLGVERIAIFYQDDSYGRAGREGVVRALESRGMELAAEGTYERNTVNVKSGLLAIRRGDPEAVIMIGAYRPCAAFIKAAKRVRMDAIFANVSFVGSKALAAELGDDGAGVLISQVVPFFEDRSAGVVADYHAALAAHAPDVEPGFVSLEGYMVGRVVVDALERVDGEPTRAALLQAIYQGGAFDLGGVSLAYGDGDSQGMDKVFLTAIDDAGGFEPLQSLAGFRGARP